MFGTAGLAVGLGALSSDAPAVGSAGTAASGASAPSRSVVEEAGRLLQAHAATTESTSEGSQPVSRSQQRPALHDSVRAARLEKRVPKSDDFPPSRQELGGALSGSVAPATPREIAASLLGSYGWDSGQFSCLDALWNKESGWNPYAENSSSGAYGIPQALPGSKMATYGADWSTNPTTQIRWGLWYISVSYGSPCGAWSHSASTGWY